MGKQTQKNRRNQGSPKSPKAKTSPSKALHRGRSSASSDKAPRRSRPSGKSKIPLPKKDVSRVCPVSASCGGCDAIEIPYDQQLARKQAEIEELFAEYKSTGTRIEPIKGMANPFHYRNKVISPYIADLSGKRGAQKPASKNGDASSKAKKSTARTARSSRPRILTGMYAQGTHQLIPTDSCATENEQAKAITLAVRDIMERYDMAPYNEDAGTGFIRHAVVRVGHTSGEVLVTVVTNGEEFPASKAFCRELVKRCPYITTIVQNVNTRQTNVILGDKERTLYGPGFILDTLCGLSFRISSKSFYQVNALQTEVLYQTAMDLAALHGTETVIDAYCGTGTIGLVAAKHGAQRVIGVDSVESAIKDARLNAQHNSIENAEYVATDAGAFLRALAAHETRSDSTDAAASGAPVTLLMDPPRAGSSETFLEAACVLGPARIVYISCNPLTQKRDVDYLCHHGYRLDSVVPVDMFPHTSHIETVALLCRDKQNA